jgi:outer membrane protein assembly factor BamB
VRVVNQAREAELRGKCVPKRSLGTRKKTALILFCALAFSLGSLATNSQEPKAKSTDWVTHRGNLERTGCVDGLPGPKKPKVLWVYRSQEHFVASPAPGGKELFISGLGAFNTASFRALALESAGMKQVRWAKSAPNLKLPVVSSPAVVQGKLVFGDGMHQTDGAVLHCLESETGLPLWQLPLPGRLVHLEGSPAIANGRVFIGGGNAGVVCVELERVTLDGKELKTAEVQPILQKRWKELLARYEEEKKKDPDFAVPPSEDQLPKPAPRRVWQQGQEQWHVDAPVAVVGDRLLAASAYLDQEKVGERCLVCLQAADGKPIWKTPLVQNPWAGPTAAGELVLVGTSSIRFDPKLIPEAKGELVASDLKTGDIKWAKPVPGGVVSSVGVKESLAVFAATDGKVRAWDVVTGQEKWSYDAKAPLFAAPALAGDLAYAADLKGIVHAIQLADGKGVWTLDLAAEPVKAPGMVYGSPVVHRGRLYVATCNLEGDRSRQPTVVVCVGE